MLVFCALLVSPLHLLNSANKKARTTDWLPADYVIGYTYNSVFSTRVRLLMISTLSMTEFLESLTPLVVQNANKVYADINIRNLVDSEAHESIEGELSIETLNSEAFNAVSGATVFKSGKKSNALKYAGSSIKSMMAVEVSTLLIHNNSIVVF
jgi:hypothetical protein